MRGFKNIFLFQLIFGVLAVGNFGSLNAQISFSVSTDSVYASKPADDFVFYNYFEFENNTADTLQMRWEKVETTSDVPGEPGNNWTISIQDPVNYYNPANDLETADFFLPPITSSTDKFLLHLFPNNQSGFLVVKFKFYPINNPSDTVTVVFDYLAGRVLGVEDFFHEKEFKIAPNPAAQYFNISNQSNQNSSISVFNAQGKRLVFLTINALETRQVNCASWPNGVYFVKINGNGKSGLKRILINNL